MAIIDIVIVPVGKDAYVAQLDHTLENMQKLVGGLLEAVELDRDHLTLWCNEEGKLLDLDMNRPLQEISDIICGDFLLTGCDAEGETIGLTKTQQELCLKRWGKGTKRFGDGGV